MKKDHIEVLLEEMNGKFDLVLEGHDAIRHELQETRQELNEKIEMNSFVIKGLGKRIDGFEDSLGKRIDGVEDRLGKVENKIGNVEDSLSKKIDAVAADLKAHRADTESHRGYKVCDGK